MMRRVLVLSVGILTLAALSACQKKDSEAAKAPNAIPVTVAPAEAVSPTAPPKRKPGLWNQTVATGGVNQTSKICLDAATDAKLSAWGQAMGSDTCSKNSVTPTAGGWKFEAVCNMGSAGTSSTTGEATGDFNSKYVVKATTVTSGSSMPQANGTHAMELTATWEGPCPAGMKPGDMTMSMPGMPKGMTMNLVDMMPKK